MTILIVDDDEAIRRTLAHRFKRAGYATREAANGREALDLIRQEKLQLVIADWCMPVMDGLELVRQIRLEALPRYVYIIMLTVKNNPEDRLLGLEAGADDYLAKPFHAAELLARVAIGQRILDLEARLNEVALRDGLTGLFNRRAFDTRLQEELLRAQRYQRALSLIMGDLDHFKNYNDRYGHIAGDQLLREAAQVLLACVRRTDFVARYGGEEFAILLPETTKANALIVAEAIRKTTAHYPFADETAADPHTATFSLGVASYPEDTPHSADLLALADQALYRAKNAGRNHVLAA